MARLLRIRIVSLVLGMAGLLAAACAPQPQGIQPGAEAPPFSLPAASGETVSLADYRGGPVLLFFHMAVG